MQLSGLLQQQVGNGQQPGAGGAAGDLMDKNKAP